MASINKRGDYQFQVIVRRKGYRTQTKTFETRTDAEKWARDVESKMDASIFQDRREVENTTLHQALQRYLEAVSPLKRGHVAEANRIKRLQRHPLALRSLASLRTTDYAYYRDERLKQVSNNTVRLELALLSHLYTIAIKEWSLPLQHALKNLGKPPSGAGRERRLIGDEENRLLNALDRPQARVSSVWLGSCIQLAVQTGMRAGEILSMDWSQVNLSTGIIRLNRTKNGSARSVPLPLEAVHVLQQLPRNSNGRVIPNFYDTAGLGRAFRRLCTAANINGLRFHDLRHEAASRLAPHMTVQTLAKVMGWKTLQMALRYYNPTDDELVKTVRRAVS